MITISSLALCVDVLSSIMLSVPKEMIMNQASLYSHFHLVESQKLLAHLLNKLDKLAFCSQ